MLDVVYCLLHEANSCESVPQFEGMECSDAAAIESMPK